jgi:hypothetical protein
VAVVQHQQRDGRGGAAAVDLSDDDVLGARQLLDGQGCLQSVGARASGKVAVVDQLGARMQRVGRVRTLRRGPEREAAVGVADEGAALALAPPKAATKTPVIVSAPTVAAAARWRPIKLVRVLLFAGSVTGCRSFRWRWTVGAKG